jgi:hypothetical protein
MTIANMREPARHPLVTNQTRHYEKADEYRRPGMHRYIGLYPLWKVTRRSAMRQRQPMYVAVPAGKAGQTGIAHRLAALLARARRLLDIFR